MGAAGSEQLRSEVVARLHGVKLEALKTQTSISAFYRTLYSLTYIYIYDNHIYIIIYIIIYNIYMIIIESCL